MANVTDETTNEVISEEAELLISEYENSINNATDYANCVLMKGFNVLVMKHGLEAVMNQIADDDRDFQWESPSTTVL